MYLGTAWSVYGDYKWIYNSLKVERLAVNQKNISSNLICRARGALAQLGRAQALQVWGSWFKSGRLHPRQARVAQSIERMPSKHVVAGLTPAGGT